MLSSNTMKMTKNGYTLLKIVEKRFFDNEKKNQCHVNSQKFLISFRYFYANMCLTLLHKIFFQNF